MTVYDVPWSSNMLRIASGKGSIGCSLLSVKSAPSKVEGAAGSLSVHTLFEGGRESDGETDCVGGWVEYKVRSL